MTSPGPGIAEARQTNVGEGDLGAVLELVDEQEVPDQQGVAHRFRRDAERLDHECPQEHGQRQRPQGGLDVFADDGTDFWPALELPLRLRL